jgi:hypothetical protein
MGVSSSALRVPSWSVIVLLLRKLPLGTRALRGAQTSSPYLHLRPLQIPPRDEFPMNFQQKGFAKP